MKREKVATEVCSVEAAKQMNQASPGSERGQRQAGAYFIDEGVYSQANWPALRRSPW